MAGEEQRQQLIQQIWQLTDTNKALNDRVVELQNAVQQQNQQQQQHQQKQQQQQHG